MEKQVTSVAQEKEVRSGQAVGETSAACLFYHTELQMRLTCKLHQENVVIQDLGGNKGVKSRKVMVQSSSRKEEKSYRVKGCSAGRCGIPSSKDLKVRGMKPQHY